MQLVLGSIWSFSRGCDAPRPCLSYHSRGRALASAHRRHASHVLLATPYGYRIAGSSVAHHPGPWRCGVGRWQQYLSGCPSPSSSCRVITSAHDAGGSAPLARGLLKAVMGRAPRGFAMFSLGHATWPGIFHHR